MHRLIVATASIEDRNFSGTQLDDIIYYDTIISIIVQVLSIIFRAFKTSPSLGTTTQGLDCSKTQMVGYIKGKPIQSSSVKG